MTDNKLLHNLDNVRRRVVAVGVAAGMGWGLAGMTVLLILFAWADLALDLSPAMRVACVWVSLMVGVALLLRGAVLSLRGSSLRSVARRVDRVSKSGGQILSGVDLLRQFPANAATASLSGAMAAMAVERAANLAERVREATAVPVKPLAWPYLSLGSVLVAVGIVALAAPRLVATQWARFADPYGDHPPFSTIEFKVEPGDCKVVYGSALDVRATPVGGAVEHVELVFRGEGQPEESVPMFPEPGGTWRATVSQVTAGGKYFVKAPGVYSAKYNFQIITVPELRDVRARITPPAYTHLPPYSGPVPEHGIAGLAGTKVEIWAKSNRPLSGGSIEFIPAATSPETQPATQPAAVAMTATSDPAEAIGSFTIAAPGKLKMLIVDTANQSSREPYAAAITVLKDERPFVRILEPKENAFATPDARIDVSISAEDDYGISSLQLFRGLNDTRATPADLPVPANQPTRISAGVPINLSDYGLTPGDVVKLYARVEDNDPAGAKGSESPVVTIHIISNDDFNRMAVAKEGLETLEAKYAMAARRLEALDNQIAKLQDELKKLPPDSPLAAEKKEAMKKLAREMQESADEVAAAAKDDLPFDIDKEFRKKLDEVAKSMADAAKETDEAAKSSPSAGKAGEKLADIRKKLGATQKQYKKEVAQPLENLDKIFPLIEDQARFVELWERQQDLAERMLSTVGKGDSPRIKARMRDLEAEQRQLSQDLNELLKDIRNHAEQLPVVSGPMVRGMEPAGTEGVANLEVASLNATASCSLSPLLGGEGWGEGRGVEGRGFPMRMEIRSLSQQFVGWAYSPTAFGRCVDRWASTPTLQDLGVRALGLFPIGKILVPFASEAMDAPSFLAPHPNPLPRVRGRGSRTASADFVGSALRTVLLGSGGSVRSADPTGIAHSQFALFPEPELPDSFKPKPDPDAVPPVPAPKPGELKDDLETLQKTALDFVRNVRNSGAMEEMNEAASDLGAFDGGRAAAKAQDAADTLKKFIKECKSMGDKAQGLCPLAFAPNISHSMGDTIGQLLGAEGLKPGDGTGSGGGFSQRRSSLRNTSLYGHIPSRSQAGGSRSGKSVAGPHSSGNTTGDPGDAGNEADLNKLHASGESDVSIPPQYREKVGKYFQRLSDELGEE